MLDQLEEPVDLFVTHPVFLDDFDLAGDTDQGGAAGMDQEQQASSSGKKTVDEEETDKSDESLRDYVLSRDRVRRQIKPPQRLGHTDLIAFALSAADTLETEEPSTVSDAKKSVDWPKWKMAMEEEMESLLKNDTWALVNKPKDQRLIGCKWIFKRKPGIEGVEKPRFKARLVAKGYSQIEGIDYHEVFSPVVKHTSIRVILAIVAIQDLELEQLDVKTAFLHGNLDETIYMTQPEGFVKKGLESKACLLKKSLYGLKQSPRQWYKRFDDFMTSRGYTRSKFDSCVYFSKLSDMSHIYLLIYVDDMLIACKSRKEIQKLKEQLASEFEMKDLGAAKKILGMDITRDRKRGVLTLSQQSYLEKVVSQFGMMDAKHVLTPIGAHFKLMAVKKSEVERGQAL